MAPCVHRAISAIIRKGNKVLIIATLILLWASLVYMARHPEVA